MKSVLLVAPTPVAEQRAGPAIRYWEFARALSEQQPVTLLVPNEDHPLHDAFTVCTSGEADLDSLFAQHRIIVVQGPAIQRHPSLAKVLAAGEHCLVVDLYVPITMEQLEVDSGGEIGRWLHLEYVSLLREQLRLGDFFLCASERQRDFWLGALTTLGRVNHDTYDRGTLKRLIDTVPFGLPATPPQAGEPVLKGVQPGIASGDRVILWGGGLWDWLDPLTPIQAMRQVREQHPTARLVFFKSERYRSAMFDQTMHLATELELLDRHVHFADWLPAEKWGSCLLEADVGLSFHAANIETRYAFRTRLLDYFWAGLPIVTAWGDVLSDQVVAHGLGYAVEPGDVEALSKALIALLGEPQARSRRRQAFGEVSEQFRWESVTEPLVRYCRQPWHAGDTGHSFKQRWQASQEDRSASDLAHAQRRMAQAEMRNEDLAQQLQQSEDRFQAAMDGRMMRLLTSVQRAARGDRG